MPLVDMPLEQLLEYQGINPKPADFEAYWERALAQLAATPDEYTLTPHPLSSDFAEAFELRFKGVGGSEVFVKYIRPKGKTGCPCILQFHGYSWFTGDWSSKLNWVAQGFAIAAMECRGQGGHSQDTTVYEGPTIRGHIIRGLEGPADDMYFRNVYLDTAQLARIVSNFPEIDNERLGAMGGSQGGALTLACASLAPIKKAAPMYPFLCDYKRVWQMDLAKGAYEELSYYFRMRDPRHEREDEIFTKLGYIDLQFLAPRIKADVLLLGALMDTITPPSTYFAAYNKIQSNKKHVIYPDFGHEGLPGGDDLIWEFMHDL
jgi:cephalosporin-C deacetylase